MPTLTFSHLRKAYATTVAVDDLSFEVRSGEVLGLLGPNGAGKTTLIRMLMDIIAPDSGEILLDGRPISAAIASSSSTPCRPSLQSSSTLASGRSIGP